MFVLPRTRDKVAIVGFATPHRDQAPFYDPEWEVWALNDAWTWMPEGSATRWFEMHSPDVYEWRKRRPAGHLDFLKRFPGQVYMHERREDVPRSVAYPLAEVAENIGRPYCTSSIAYMLGLALLLGFQTIGIWGVDMEHDTEYAEQRPCVEFLCGVARGRGVEVVTPDASSLMRGPFYGRGFLTDGGERITHGQLERRLRLLVQRDQRVRALFDYVAGVRVRLLNSLDAVNRLSEGVADRAAVIASLRDELHALLSDADASWHAQKTEVDTMTGMLSELRYWIDKTPEAATQDAPTGHSPGADQIAAPPVR